MDIPEKILRYVKPEDRKKLCYFLMNLVLIIVIAGEIYDDFRYMTCLIRSGDRLWPVAIVKRILFLKLLLFLYYGMKWLKKKVSPRYAVRGVIIFCLLTSWINGSVFGIFFWDGPYWGRVTDADTGEPVVGASVVGRWRFEGYQLYIGLAYRYADARETVTGRNGWFLLPVARNFLPWPFTRIRLDEIIVFKPGYDSHPPLMYYAWTDEDREKWRIKLKRKLILNRFYNRRYSAEWNYRQAFGINASECGFCKPIMIRLNKAGTIEEQHMTTSVSFDVPYCESHVKIPRIRNLIDEEEKRLRHKRKTGRVR